MKLITTLLLVFAMASPALAKESITTEIIKQPGQKWHFQDVASYKSNGNAHVSGRLTANTRFGLPRGHIDIAAYSPSGRLISETTTDYSPSILTYRMKLKGGVRFSADLPESLPANSVVKIAFHQDERPHQLNSVHTDNIAR